ncbi:eukaryotic translation initiation factor 2B subunit gamma [Lycorma delicatula]|uniref:eukaryotic translation initiation factor 2B subunit gamma n=1 Tax=Lycorma delicatula TaxID=130591 RepID=UPI003F5188F2
MTNCQEFQAIVMAGGKGSRMTELTAEKPKCLLPVGNLPLLWYPLQLLERSKFLEAIVVVSESVRNEVQSALEQHAHGVNKLLIKIEFVGIPSNEDWGTADSLRHLYELNKIKHDVLVVSCDLISDINLTGVIKIFRQHNAALSALFFASGSPKYTSPAPGSTKTDKKHEKDLIGIDPATSRLVFVASASDYDEELPLSQALLKKHGKIQIHSRLLDAHLYIMKDWIYKYLAQNKSISTIKGELLPFIVKKQTSRANRNRIYNGKPENEKPINSEGDNLTPDISQFAYEDELTQKIRDMSSWSDHSGDWFGPYHGDHIRCYAYIEQEKSFGCRVNTIPAYCYVNREIKGRWSRIIGKESIEEKDDKPKEELKGAAKDLIETCIVDEKATVSNRCHIISTNIGANAVIEPKSKFNNCIIMPGVKINEKCDLKNCILFDGAIIGEGCSLADCIVGKHYELKDKESYRSKVLTEIDHLMEI